MSVDIAAERKILHIIHGFGPGGVETWLLSAVKYLHDNSRLNIKFDFMLTGGVAGIYDDEVKQYGSKVFYNRYSNKSILRFGRNFKEILRGNKYFAIHDHQDFISGWHFFFSEESPS